MDKPVVIIGAGMAGLTTAAYLSRTGLKVDVYEQHTLPGGYISSFVREGFTFPAGPTSITSNGIVFPILKELGLAEKRNFLHVGHQMSWGEHDVPLRNARQVRDKLSQYFPVQCAALKHYFRWVEIGGNGFRQLVESGMMFGQGILPKVLNLLVKHPLLPVPDFVLPGLFLLFVMGLSPLVLTFGLLLALGVVLLIWLTVQAVMIGFSAGIQYVMVVNGLAILGSALWPSVRNAFREENQ